jgi:hypothetical protein
MTCQGWSGSCRPAARRAARITSTPTTPGSSASIPVVGDLVLSFNDETVRRRRPDNGAEPSSPSHEALNLHGSWAATLDQAEAANAVDRLDRQRQSPLADPGYRTGFTGHGTMVMPNSDSPGPTIAHLKGGGPGASDNVSDNDSRLRPTQRDVSRHRDPSELR